MTLTNNDGLHKLTQYNLVEPKHSPKLATVSITRTSKVSSTESSFLFASRYLRENKSILREATPWPSDSHRHDNLNQSMGATIPKHMQTYWTTVCSVSAVFSLNLLLPTEAPEAPATVNKWTLLFSESGWKSRKLDRTPRSEASTRRSRTRKCSLTCPAKWTWTTYE